MSRITILLFSLSVFLGACAPSVYGSRYNAFDFVNGIVFPVSGSGTWYATGSFLPDEFGIELDDIPDAAFRGREGDSFSQNLNGDFELTALELPEGWSVKFNTITGTQTLASVADSRRYTRIRYYSIVDVVLRIEIPEFVSDGSYPIEVNIKARNGDSVVKSWMVFIEGGAVALDTSPAYGL